MIALGRMTAPSITSRLPEQGLHRASFQQPTKELAGSPAIVVSKPGRL